MTKTRRDKRKEAERARGAHTAATHQRRPDPAHPGHQLPVNCPRCATPSPHLSATVTGETARQAARWRP